MDKNQPSPFSDQEKAESTNELLGSILEKWRNDKRVKSNIWNKDIAEIEETENFQGLIDFIVILGKLNVMAGLIEEETCRLEVFNRTSQFGLTSYAYGLETSHDLFLKSNMPDSAELMVNTLSYPLIYYAHELIRGVKESGLKSDEEIEKYYETSIAGIKNMANLCYSKGLLTGFTLQSVKLEEIAQINHIEKIIPYLKKYERKIRDLKKVFNRYPGIFGSKHKWERKVLVIAQELAEISNHLPDKDRPGDKDNFWSCLYKINGYSESILSNWSHYLNDPSTIGAFQSMEQTRKYMEKIDNYSDKLELEIGKIEISVKSQD